jgi:uncharacterized protein
MKKICSVVTVIVLILLSLGYFGGGYMVYDRLSAIGPPDVDTRANTPTNYVVTDPEYATFDASPYQMAAYEAVRFPSRQTNIHLSGWYIEIDPAAPVVIVTHGMRASKKSANVLVPAGMLSRGGFNVLMYDLRNHDESDRDNGRTSIGNKEYQDVLGAWEWLIHVKGYSPERVGVYGVSLGGATTLDAFGEEPRIAAVFVDSPFGNLREIINAELTRNHYPTILTTPVILMARIVAGDRLLDRSPTDAIYNDHGRPIYIVHGTGDERVSVDQTRDLAALAKQTGANLTVWIPEGVGHVGGVFVHPNEYQQKLVEFFHRALK